MHSWGPVMRSSLTKKPKAGRRDWSPVGVVVPLDEGNAGGREKSMWQWFPLRMTISKDYTYISVPCYLIIAIKCIY